MRSTDPPTRATPDRAIPLTAAIVALRRKANVLQLSGLRQGMRVHDQPLKAQVREISPVGRRG